jgi:uncharacterized protein (DUF302 family)
MKDRGLVLRRVAASGLLLTGLPWTTTAHSTEASMTDAKRLQSAYPFADTVQKLRSTLEGRGFTIFAAIDQREAAKSVGLDMPPTTLLVYGNPKGGTPLMIAAPDFGLELPLKVLVREEAGGKVLVVYMPASSLEGRHGLPAGLAEKLAGAEPLIAAAIGAPPR